MGKTTKKRKRIGKIGENGRVCRFSDSPEFTIERDAGSRLHRTLRRTAVGLLMVRSHPRASFSSMCALRLGE